MRTDVSWGGTGFDDVSCRTHSPSRWSRLLQELVETWATCSRESFGLETWPCAVAWSDPTSCSWLQEKTLGEGHGWVAQVKRWAPGAISKKGQGTGS